MTIYKVNAIIVIQAQKLETLESTYKEVNALPSAMNLFNALKNFYCEVPTLTGSVTVLKDDWQKFKNIRKQIFAEISTKMSQLSDENSTHALTYTLLRNCLENIRVKNEPLSANACYIQNIAASQKAVIDSLKEVKKLYPKAADELSKIQAASELDYAKVMQNLEAPPTYAHVYEPEPQPTEYKPVYTNVYASITKNLFIAGGCITGGSVIGAVLLGIFFPPLLPLAISFIVTGLIILLAALIRTKIQAGV